MHYQLQLDTVSPAYHSYMCIIHLPTSFMRKKGGLPDIQNHFFQTKGEKICVVQKKSPCV